MSDRASRQVFFFGLLVIVGLGTVARLWQVNESLWLDELHTSWVVSDTVDEIAPRARIGNQSPLYFYIVRLSTLVLGENELALRMPSLLAGVGLICATGIITWRVCGVISAGWLAATLVALDHNMIFFSQEARSYALVQIIALVHLVAFWRLQTAPSWRYRLAVVGGWVVLFHLHYTTILLVAGELAWWAAIQFWQRGKGGYRPTHVFCDVTVTVAACAITWSHLADIATRRAMWELFIFQKPPWVALRWFHCGLYVLIPVVLCVGLAVADSVWRRRNGAPQVAGEIPGWIAVVPLLVMWWTVPVAIAWSLTASDLVRVFFPRYLIGVAVAPMICAGLGVTICRGPGARAAATVAIIACAVYGNGVLGQFLHDGRLITDRRQDWRGAVAWLNATRDDAAPVLVRSGLIEADRIQADSDDRLRRFCLLPVTSLYSIQGPGALAPLSTSRTGRLSNEAVGLLRRHGGGWFVINARPATHERLRRDLRASFPHAGLVFLRESSFGNVAVWQVRLEDR